MTLTVTHSKTLVSPSTGSADKVYGADYVSPTSHTVSGTADGVTLVVPTSNQTANGSTTSAFNAGETVAIMELVYMHSDGEWHLTDADAAATASGMLAIALQAKNDGQAMSVALHGSLVRNDTWNWTAGATLYVSATPGAITATAPSATDDVVRVVGWAVSADAIWFQPSSDYATVV